MTYRTSALSQKLMSVEEEIILGRVVQQGQAATAAIVAASADGGRMDPVTRRTLKAEELAGKDAVREFTERNMRLAMNVAAKYNKAQPNMDYEDLIQEAIIGLHRAVEKFDPGRGFKFSTYATWWCRQACQRAVANQSRSVRLPMHVEAEVRKLQRAMEKIESVTGVLPSIVEVANELGWEAEDCRNLLAYLDVTRVSSLDDPISDDSSLTREDTIFDSSAPLPEDLGILKQRATEIRDAVSFLSDREREILYMRHGIGEHDEPMTLQQIGKALGLTRERIRQLEAKAISKLRHPSSGIVEAFQED
jgi:RNA polymerase primary sigma factor